MKKELSGIPLLALLMAAITFGACSSTSITDTWKAAQIPQKSYRQVAVVGITTSEGSRRRFEDVLVRQLEEHGVNAQPTYGIIDDANLSLKRLQPKLEDKNIDAILTTRVIGVDKDVTYIPGDPFIAPYYSYYDPYYFHSLYHPFYYSPGYLSTNVQVELETNLYDAETGKLIWSAQSETRDPSSVSALANSVGEPLVKRLLKSGIVS